MYALQLDRTIEAVEECLTETGALVHCPRCGGGLLIAQDDAAERRAYDRAEHLRRAGLRAFEAMTEREVRAAIAATLDTAPTLCRSCGNRMSNCTAR